MRKSLLDLIKLCLPLSARKRESLEVAAPYLSERELSDIKHFLKRDVIFGYVHDHGTSVIEAKEWAEFKTHRGDKTVKQLIKTVNERVKEAVDEELYERFEKEASEKIPSLVANNIVGLTDEKFAASLLLFAKDPIHILLLGDPGTGKTEILRSITALAPKAVFGLGSGASGVGLAATFKGDKLQKGILPRADGGIACVDELNLMKAHDRASLYNAMEKGFVTYDKGGKHETIPARISLLASANPKQDKFVGKGASVLKKQVPFEQALLSRFHLVALVRRPDRHEMGAITRKMVSGSKQQLKKGDVDFVKGYVSRMLERDVSFPKRFEPMVVNLIEDLHEDEKKFLVEVGPRTVHGIMRLSKAYARMQGKDVVEQDDLVTIMELIKRAYYVRK